MVHPRLAGVIVLASFAVGYEPQPVTCAPAAQPGRDVTVHARKYSFDPPRIEVQQDDLVKITLISDDIPHSFTIDDYRIVRRVAAGQTTVFEFRADRAGTFAFYCNLTTDERCKEMHGELVVSRK